MRYITTAERIGLEKGEFIGEIRMAQRVLKRPISEKDDLMQCSMEELNPLFQSLQEDLATLN